MRKLTIIAIIFFLVIIINTNVNCAYTVTGIENFPEQYIGYLQVLKNKYPNMFRILIYLLQFLILKKSSYKIKKK